MKLISKLVLVFFVFMVSCNPGKNTNQYKLNVKVTGLDKGEKVYLLRTETQSPAVPVDSLVFNQDGDELVFSGTLEHSHPYWLVFGNHRGAVEIFMDPTDLTVTGDVSDISNVIVKGAPSHLVYQQAIDGLKKIDSKEMELYESYQAADKKGNELQKGIIEQEYSNLVSERESYLVRFTKQHPSSQVGPYLLNAVIHDINFTKVNPVYEMLSEEVKSSAFGKLLGERLAIAKNTSIGSSAPLFSAHTPSGETLALKETLGKVTVIDFWASWCKPCRNENPNVVKMYSKLHDKGLEIVSVSLDTDPSAWKEAIEQDNLTWYHVSDLHGFKSPIAQKYGIMAIPQTYVLDENGIIMAKGLRGEALENKVAELLAQ